MKTITSFLVQGPNSNKAFFDLVINNRLLRSQAGLADCIVGTHPLKDQKTLVLVDRGKFVDLQERQRAYELTFPSQSVEPFQASKLNILLAMKPISDKMAAAEVEEHQQNAQKVQEILRKADIRFQVFDVDKIDQAPLDNFNLAVVLGGDGTFLKFTRFLKNKKIPLFGVNSAPSSSFAHYLRIKSETFEETLNRLLKCEFAILNLPRIDAHLVNNKLEIRILPLALNDLFIKDNAFAKATRNFISLADREEFSYSDGLLISLASATGLNSWMNNAGGIFVAEGSSLLQVLSFNANSTDRSGNPNFLRHFVADGGFEIKSANRHDPHYAVNGELEGSFPHGSRLIVKGANQPVQFIVFPNAQEDLKETPIVPEINLTEDPTLTSDLIEQIDQMSVCSSVKTKEKKQILFLRPSPDLESLKILLIKKFGGKSLTREDIIQVAEIKDAKLLFPTAEIAGFPSVERDIIFNLYRYGNYITEMNGVLIEWESAKDVNVWGPSIDTILFLFTLLKHNLFNVEIEIVGDVGTGSGMLAKAAVIYCPKLKRLEISDIEENALYCARRNIRPVLRKGIIMLSLPFPGIRRFGKVDLMLVNPPYLPKRKSLELNQYEGTGLIREIISNGLAHLTDNPKAAIVKNYSSLAKKDFESYLKGRDDLVVEELESFTVPLKINWAQIDSEWMDYLLTECGLEVRDDRVHSYRYWHTLNFVKITRKK
jgi:NAD kinase/predicted RNA methylase